MSIKPYAALAIGLALLSSSPAFADDPVKQFTFHLAGLNITRLMPEVKRIIVVCRIDNHLGIRVSEGRRYYDVTEVNGERAVHTGPITIGQNIGDLVGAPPPGAQGWQPGNARSWECHLEIEHRDSNIMHGIYSMARAGCPADDANAWACTQTGTSAVLLQAGQF